MISIRKATIEDLQQLQELNKKVFVNNPLFDPDYNDDFNLSPQSEQFFKESIERTDGCCFIAEEGGKMIGYVDGSPKPISYRKNKYFNVDDLGVLPEYKGKGIAKQLLDALTSWAKDRGYQKLYIECYAKNEEALAFYKKHGYEVIDISLEKVI